MSSVGRSLYLSLSSSNGKRFSMQWKQVTPLPFGDLVKAVRLIWDTLPEKRLTWPNTKWASWWNQTSASLYQAFIICNKRAFKAIVGPDSLTMGRQAFTICNRDVIFWKPLCDPNSWQWVAKTYDVQQTSFLKVFLEPNVFYNALPRLYGMRLNGFWKSLGTYYSWQECAKNSRSAKKMVFESCDGHLIIQAMLAFQPWVGSLRIPK
jgi:hypothetical protein